MLLLQISLFETFILKVVLTFSTYFQKIRKIKRNLGKKYSYQRLLENLNETERKRIFDMFWNLGDLNKQNILLYEATG